ncbi:MAG: hypothetical protein AABY16_03185 [Nanoarchaeota archaeon]
MVLRKRFFSVKIWPLVFLAFAFVLAIFSLFYADWYQKSVTGFVITYCGPDPDDCPQGTSGGGTSSAITSEPPSQVLVASSESSSYVTLATNYIVGLAEENLIVKDYSKVSVSSSGTFGQESSFDTPTAVSTEPNFVNPCDSNPNSVACFNQLNTIKSFIQSTLTVALQEYNEVLAYEDRFSSIKISADAEAIRANTILIEDILANLNLQLVKTSEQISERQQRIAQNIVDNENYVEDSTDKLESYVSKYESVTPKSDLPTESVGGEVVVSDCVSSVDAILLGSVDTGNVGFDTKDGGICEIKVPEAKPVPGSGASTTTIVNPGGPPESINPPAVSSSGGGNSFAFYVLHDKDGAPGAPREAFAAALSPAGNFVLAFLSASSNYELEKKIRDFVQKVTLGLHEGILTGATVSAGISEEPLRKNVPWLLWLALIAVAVPFIFFSSYLLPTHERLILDGRRAIARRDFARAADLYKEIASRYIELRDENGEDMRQEILEYFILLRSALRAMNVKFDINVGANKFPNIIFIGNSFNKVYTDAQRVEKLLHDSLHDLRIDRKSAALRAPAISEMYSRLGRRDKEKLAPLYERFIYGFRDVRK